MKPVLQNHFVLRIFNNLIAPSTLKEGADIYLFRLNVEPKWEDHFNQAGGNFFFYLAPQGGYDQQLDADAIWLNLVAFFSFPLTGKAWIN
jgi:hypothetical protein